MGEAACKSCGARVRWLRTAGGRNMPVDAEPVPDGNVVVLESGTARVLTREEAAAWNGPAFRSHFATCPQAKSHRRSS